MGCYLDKPWAFHPLTNQTFHNIWASIAGDRHFFYNSETSIDELWEMLDRIAAADIGWNAQGLLS